MLAAAECRTSLKDLAESISTLSGLEWGCERLKQHLSNFTKFTTRVEKQGTVSRGMSVVEYRRWTLDEIAMKCWFGSGDAEDFGFEMGDRSGMGLLGGVETNFQNLQSLGRMVVKSDEMVVVEVCEGVKIIEGEPPVEKSARSSCC